MNIKYSAIIFFLLTFFFANAQKLPAVQTASHRAPADIKIDGKSTEWSNKFQAYNNATSAFYTIANDDDNLYLIIQVSDIYVLNKIFSSGITFIINKSGEKSDENTISITYPVIDRTGRPNIDLTHKPGGDNSDSVVNANNMHIANKVKWINVTGIKGLDTLTSVYNREGIKAAGLFDNKMAYTYELSISLKNLGLAVNTSPTFAYHLKFNGADINSMNGYTTGPVGKNGFPSYVHIEPGALLLNPDNLRIMKGTTDFWGKYTLIKR